MLRASSGGLQAARLRGICCRIRRMASVSASPPNTPAVAAEDGSERRVAVVGGGISGLFCASTLSQYGYDVSVFDMGRSHPAGRMSTRRTAWRSMQFDHGCQFIRAASPALRAAVEGWAAAGAAAQWRGRIGELDAASGRFTPREELAAAARGGGGGGDGEGHPAAGSLGFLGVLAPGPLYVGTPSMDAICAHLARGGSGGGGGGSSGGALTVRSDIRVRRAHLDADQTWLLEGDVRQPLRTAAERKQSPPFAAWNLGAFDALVLADRMAGCPGTPGHVAIEGPPSAHKLQAQLQAVGAVPALALLLGFDAPPAGAPPLLPFDGASVRGSDTIAWIALDSSKPGRGGGGGSGSGGSDGSVSVVALATPEFSARLCPRNADGSLPPQTPELLAALAPALHAALADALAAARVALPEPAFVQAHRWGAAFPAAPLGARVSCLVAANARLAACGDYCAGGGVEGAVTSARAAADAVRAMFES